MVMRRYISIIVSVLALVVGISEGRANNIIVADSTSHIPLPNASVYDRNGTAIGMSDRNGVLPTISPGSYPITVRYLGFNDKSVSATGRDTIFLSYAISELAEVIVETKQQKVLHILAYIRDSSSLTTFTDTVSLFREKMVDYMLPPDGKTKFKGWTTPRILTSRSYYRFTNASGLDSVSDESRYHFSWSDWVGIPPVNALPPDFKGKETGSCTKMGKYSPAEIWNKKKDRVEVDIDVLADSAGRKWIPDLWSFFRKDLEFEKLKLHYNYDLTSNVAVNAEDLTGYSYKIESTGRGHGMFWFNKKEEPFFVSTNSEVYILDKEYITVKEAKKWSRRKFDTDEIGIYEPLDAPALSSDIQKLIDRVNNIDKGGVRLDCAPDHRLMSMHDGRNNFKIGQRALILLKQLCGITLYKTHKNINRNWSSFRNEQIKRNSKPIQKLSDKK